MQKYSSYNYFYIQLYYFLYIITHEKVYIPLDTLYLLLYFKTQIELNFQKCIFTLFIYLIQFKTKNSRI